MAHVQNGAAKAEHREVSVSLLLSNKKVSLGRKFCMDWLVADYQENLERTDFFFHKNAGEQQLRDNNFHIAKVD